MFSPLMLIMVFTFENYLNMLDTAHFVDEHFSEQKRASTNVSKQFDPKMLTKGVRHRAIRQIVGTSSGLVKV